MNIRNEGRNYLIRFLNEGIKKCRMELAHANSILHLYRLVIRVQH